jgi:phosphoglucomutase
MRGSGTEPVFRLMADVAGADRRAERELLEWQRAMISEADSMR